MNASAKTYVRKFSAAMAAYVVVLLGTTLLVNQMADSVWRYPLAVLPVIPVIFAVFAYLEYLSRIDELAQRIQLQALGFAFGVTGLVTFSYGLLQNIGLPAIPWVWIFPAMIALWGLGTLIASRRYQ